MIQTKLNCFIKSIKYLVRLSPQSGQRWGFLPSSSVTCNIYKPLKRINQEGNGGAVLPITRARPSGFVTVDLMDLCDAEGFQSCCFGTRPLLEPIASSAAQRRTGARGWAWTALLTNTVMLRCPLAEAIATSFIPGAGKVSRSGYKDHCAADSYTCYMSLLHGCLQTVTWLNCIHASLVEADPGGQNHLRNFN